MNKLLVFKVVLIAAVSALVCVVCTGKKSSGEIESKIIAFEFIYENAPFHQFHALAIIETGNNLLASGFGGAKENNFSNCIYISEKKEGKWSTRYLLPMG